jgi:hypothetical protein
MLDLEFVHGRAVDYFILNFANIELEKHLYP